MERCQAGLTHLLMAQRSENCSLQRRALRNQEDSGRGRGPLPRGLLRTRKANRSHSLHRTDTQTLRAEPQVLSLGSRSADHFSRHR